MKIEFLESGSLDCPLIRLFEFDTSELLKLKQSFEGLIRGKLDLFQLDKEEYLKPIENCKLAFRIAKTNEGIIPNDKSPNFICLLNNEGYQRVVDLMEPFCLKKEQKAGFYQ